MDPSLTGFPAQAIWSFIVYGGSASLELWAPQYFYRIVSLVGQILAVIFWLAGWAWSASGASALLASANTTSLFGVTVVNDTFKQLGSALAACAGLGAVVW